MSTVPHQSTLQSWQYAHQNISALLGRRSDKRNMRGSVGTAFFHSPLLMCWYPAHWSPYSLVCSDSTALSLFVSTLFNSGNMWLQHRCAMYYGESPAMRIQENNAPQVTEDFWSLMTTSIIWPEASKVLYDVFWMTKGIVRKTKMNA